MQVTALTPGSGTAIYEIGNGKLTRWTVYDDVRKALEAVGLPE